METPGTPAAPTRPYPTRTPQKINIASSKISGGSRLSKESADYAQLSRTRRAIFEYVETEEVDFERALDIQAKLAKNSQLRSGKIPDMVMAAIAIRTGLVLLHYDSDFDAIGAVDQRLKHERVVPRGSVN